jgi:hypothetical protein
MLKFRRARPMLSGEPDQRDIARGGDLKERSPMSLDITPIGPVDPGVPTAASQRRAPVAADSAEISTEIPASPPPEVLDAIGAAARRYDELLAQGRELRFRTGADGLAIELRDADGALLRTLRPSEALDVATGASVE